ncbi:M42 family metallopeptidase [Clostridium kluyveri]|uniref:Hydrolase n=1 Tax=Clostridium kluyveri TaxID=1534 RepID=A0A1L5FDR8_CLOKL|nr:M42 family peptidase [Clostridium kluyveri]APM41103.1 hydrolase [Clostridium kluyveri]
MFLEKLCNSIGPSGYEEHIRNVIRDELSTFTDNILIDRMGNIIVHKDRQNDSLPKIMVISHVDELGLIITAYNKDGTLKFSTLGDIDKNSLPAKAVLIGDKKIPGVIGMKPIHIQSKKEKDENISYENMCIDIGASSEEECRRIISLGDFVVFNNEFSHFGDNLLKGKALDNRVGCSILMELLKEDLNCNLYGVFNVQGNIDQRGIHAAAYNINPDMVIILDTINSIDYMEIPSYFRTSKLREGPVIPFKGGQCIFDRGIVESIRNKADDIGIPYQKIGDTHGEGELKAAYLTVNNCKTASILLPCRYMNFNISICSLADYDNTLILLKSYLEDYSINI